MIENRLLSLLARTIARSTRITGYRGAGRVLGMLGSIPTLRHVVGRHMLASGKTLTFPAYDYYWAQFLWTRKSYEPDVEAIMTLLVQAKPCLFVDGGANIGYWTLRLADPTFGISAFAAIEANPEIFRYLDENCAANGLSGTAIWAAVADEDGLTVHIDSSAGHAVGTVGTTGTPVDTVTISSVINRYVPEGSSGPILVKLDVEGSEIAAFRGAEHTERPILFVYEDWPGSGFGVTQHLLDAGYAVFGLDAGMKLQRIYNLAAAAMLNGLEAGYHPSNLVATRRPNLVPR